MNDDDNDDNNNNVDNNNVDNNNNVNTNVNKNKENSININDRLPQVICKWQKTQNLRMENIFSPQMLQWVKEVYTSEAPPWYLLGVTKVL